MCSHLNNSLPGNHIRDNPLCDSCGMVEAATQPISINLILYINVTWNAETNIVFFKATQGYIHVSKRF